MNAGTFVLGTLNGLTIGLLAVGLVLVYKSNRFLNLAHAQMGALSALFVAKSVADWGWNYGIAFVSAVALAVVIGLTVDRFIVAPVRRRTSSPMRLLLLSLGVSQLLLALTFIPALGPDTSRTTVFPQPFVSTLRLGGVRLTGMDILTAILVPLLVAGLAVFMRYTVYGKQIRAAANNADAAQLCGISVERVSALTWALAGAFSGVSAVLQAPQQASFNVSALGPYLLMLTLGAAAFGAFVSLPGALLGGLVLGVVNQAVAAQTGEATTALLTVFLLILGIVFVRGRAIARVFELTGAPVEDLPATRVPAALRDRPLVRHQPVVLGVVALIVLAVWPLIPYFSTTSRQFLLSLVLIYAILGVALTVLLGWGGQVSLGNFAVVGLGAYLTARWSEDWTLTMLVLVIGVVGAVAMVIVGLPALRIRGLTLALTTLGFAVIAHDWLYHQSWVAGDNALAATVEAPSHGPGLGAPGDQRAVYYVALALLALTVLTTSALRRSGPGRLFIAVRDNERASAAYGVTPATVKLSVLAVSGFFSGAAGVLWAISWRAVSTTQFTADFSMAILAIPVIGGLGSIGGAVAAAVLLYSMTFFIGPEVQGLFGDLGQNLGFSLFLAGAGVIGVIMQFPHGIAGAAQALWQRTLDRRATRTSSSVAGAADGPLPDATDIDMSAVQLAGGGGPRSRALEVGGLLGRVAARARPADDDGDPDVPLAVQGVRMTFGGIVALDQPDVVVRPGEIVGLIGTNGAGKTTLLNVVSGVLRPDEGSVRVFGNEVVDLPPDFRAALGLGRSFQDASLFAGLTVRETIEVALSQREKVGIISAMLSAPWGRLSERRIRREADDILGRFGLLPWADARTSELSTGTRRICDLAAQVAARPALILLDEPTAGVAQREAEAFGPLLRRIRDELDCAVLIVEHDMPLLMGLCDRLYALEAGRVIAEGPPAEIREDERVVASYLGTSDEAIGRSGATADGAAAATRARSRARASAGDGPLLSVRDIDFSYGQLQVLFGISLEVRRGEALALLGTNGAGKSTVLRVVAGLEVPDAGSVTLGERDITGVPATRLASEGLALISGGRSVFTDMTVEENLQMQALQIRKQRRLVEERTEQVLATFPRLAERLSQPAGKLSGGEQQQLALARALLLDPEVLCIDELSLGLAPVVVGELLDIVRQLHDAGTTLVVVEQSLNIAASLCERAVFLEKGAVRFTGRTADLLEQDDIARAVFFGGAVSADAEHATTGSPRVLETADARAPT